MIVRIDFAFSIHQLHAGCLKYLNFSKSDGLKPAAFTEAFIQLIYNQF